MIYALVAPDDTIKERSADADPTVKTRAGWRWLLVEATGNGAYDPAAQVREGPVTTIEPARVLDTYSTRSKTAEELDADKGASITNAQRDDLLTIILALENDNRTIKAKINQLITDISATTAKFTNGQASQITKSQLITGLKALL